MAKTDKLVYVAALLGLILLQASIVPASGQITVLPGIQISADAPQARYAESWLAVNPRDSKNLIATSIVFGKRKGSAVYASWDGGQHWVRATHGANADSFFEDEDPMVVFDAGGSAYFTTLYQDFSVWKSTNGGRTWGERVAVPGGPYDRQFLASDTSQGPFRGRLYAAGKFTITVFVPPPPRRDVIAIAYSEDGGASFSFPRILLPAPDKEVLHAVSDLIVSPDGKLIVPYVTFEIPKSAVIKDAAYLTEELLKGHLWTIVSENGGRSFSQPRHVASFQAYGNAREWQSRKGLGVGGIAIDATQGPYKGRLYLTWLGIIDDRYQVMVATSADGGQTWSTPMRVNDNHTASNQSNPAIAVNDDGVVGIVWNDRRNDKRDACYQPFFAVSADGGASFSPNIQLSKGLTCPSGPAPTEGAVDMKDFGQRFMGGGETQGIVGLPNGGFHLAWINGESGVMQLWSTIVRVDRRQLQKR